MSPALILYPRTVVLWCNRPGCPGSQARRLHHTGSTGFDRQISFPDAGRHHCRVMQPAVREGWLKHGPGGASEGRAGERFISVIWECALDLVESALKRERKTPPKETS